VTRHSRSELKILRVPKANHRITCQLNVAVAGLMLEVVELQYWKLTLFAPAHAFSLRSTSNGGAPFGDEWTTSVPSTPVATA